jgi:hypothetical protein
LLIPRRLPLDLLVCTNFPRAAINKSQGQTLERIAVFLAGVEPGLDGRRLTVNCQPCFAHGQLYVALSRVGHPDRVSIYLDETQYATKSTPTIVYTEVLLDTDRGRHGTPLPTTPDVRHVEEDDRADGEGSEPPDSEQIGLAVPFAVGASSQWARYLGGRFAPSNVDELADDLSWLLCPLMADAAGLAELFPHPVAPRPELTGVWAGLPQWSHCSSPVRNLTWTRLVELAAGALGERHRVVGHSGTLREAMVESMDRRNHWPAVMQQDLLDRLDSLPTACYASAPAADYPDGLRLSDALLDAAEFLATDEAGLEMVHDYCGTPIEFEGCPIFEPALDPVQEPEDVYTPEQLFELDARRPYATAAAAGGGSLDRGYRRRSASPLREAEQAYIDLMVTQLRSDAEAGFGEIQFEQLMDLCDGDEPDASAPLDAEAEIGEIQFEQLMDLCDGDEPDASQLLDAETEFGEIQYEQLMDMCDGDICLC